jgi:hypothetical protein
MTTSNPPIHWPRLRPIRSCTPPYRHPQASSGAWKTKSSRMHSQSLSAGRSSFRVSGMPRVCPAFPFGREFPLPQGTPSTPGWRVVLQKAIVACKPIELVAGWLVPGVRLSQEGVEDRAWESGSCETGAAACGRWFGEPGVGWLVLEFERETREWGGGECALQGVVRLEPGLVASGLSNRR